MLLLGWRMGKQGRGIVRLRYPSQCLECALCKMEAFQRTVILSPNSSQDQGNTNWCFKELLWKDTPEFWSLYHVEMRREWRAGICSPLMLRWQTHVVGEQGALSGVMFLSGMWGWGSQGLLLPSWGNRSRKGTLHEQGLWK